MSNLRSSATSITRPTNQRKWHNALGGLPAATPRPQDRNRASLREGSIREDAHARPSEPGRRARAPGVPGPPRGEAARITAPSRHAGILRRTRRKSSVTAALARQIHIRPPGISVGPNPPVSGARKDRRGTTAVTMADQLRSSFRGPRSCERGIHKHDTWLWLPGGLASLGFRNDD
jgi:hypothetical protein